MDDRISQLQSMFPSIEGDVIGVVLNESDNNVEEALEKLLWLSSGSPISSPVSTATTSTADPQDVSPPHQPRQSNWSWLSPGYGDTTEPSARSKKAKGPQSNPKNVTNSPPFRARGGRNMRKGRIQQQQRDSNYAATPTTAGTAHQRPSGGHDGSMDPLSTSQYPYYSRQLVPYYQGQGYYPYGGGPQLQPGWVDPSSYQVPYQQVYQSGNSASLQPNYSSPPLNYGTNSTTSSGMSGMDSAAESSKEEEEGYFILGSQPNQSSGQDRPTAGELEDWPIHSNPQSENPSPESDASTSDREKAVKSAAAESCSEMRSPLLHVLQSSDDVSSVPADLRADDPGSVPKVVVILRGLPGSGKSTLARQLVGSTGIICCTDDFFVVNGQYVFDPSLLEENHEKNRLKAREALLSGVSPVIIDNTNTVAWEMKPYVTLAHEFGYKVELREPNTTWKFRTAELTRRNGHGVPRQAIERMLERYQHRLSVDSILASQPPERSREQQAPREKHSSHFPQRQNHSHRPHPPPPHSSTSPSGSRRHWQNRYRDTYTMGQAASVSPNEDHTHPSRLPRKPASSRESASTTSHPSRHLNSSPGPSPNISPNPSPRSRKRASPITAGYQGQWQEGADKIPLPEQTAPSPPGLASSSTDSTASGLTVALKNTNPASVVAQPSNSTFGEKVSSVSTMMRNFESESEDLQKDPLGSTSRKASEVKVSTTCTSTASIDSTFACSDLPRDQQWGGTSTSAQLGPQQEWGDEQKSGSLFGNSTGTASHCGGGGGGMLYNSIWSPSPQPGDSSSLVLEGWGSNREPCPRVDETSDTFVGKPLTSQTEWVSSHKKPKSDSPIAQLQPLSSETQSPLMMAGNFFSGSPQTKRSVDHEAKWSPTGQQDTASRAQAQPELLLQLNESQVTAARLPSNCGLELLENPLPSRDPVLPVPSDQFQTPGTVFSAENRSDSSFDDPAILEKGYKCKALEQIPTHDLLQGEAVLGRFTGLALSVLPHSLIPPVDATMNVSCLPPSSERRSEDALAHGLDPALESSTHFAAQVSAHHTSSHSHHHHHHHHRVQDLFSSPRTKMVCGETRNDREATKTSSQSSPFQVELELGSVHVPQPGLTSNPTSDNSLTLGAEAVSDSFNSYFPSAFANSQLGNETTSSAKDNLHLLAPHEASLMRARADTVTDDNHGLYEYGDSTEPDTPIAYASTNPLSYPHESISTSTINGAGIDGDLLQVNPEVPNSSELVGVRPLQAAIPVAFHGDPDSTHPSDVGNPDPWLHVAEPEGEEISNVSNVSNASSGEQPQEDSFLADLASTPSPALWGRLTSNTLLTSSLHRPPSPGTGPGEVCERPDGGEGEHTIECMSCTASASDDRDTNTVKEDLVFLAECFPDLEPSYLRLLYSRCRGNVEEVVSHAVLSSLNPVSPRREFASFHYMDNGMAESSQPVSDTETSSTLSSVSYASDDDDDILDDEEEEGGELRDIESATERLELLQLGDAEPSGFDSLLNEQGPPATEDVSAEMLEGLENPDECIDDGEIARLLQELEASEEVADAALLAESHGRPRERQSGYKPRATDDVALPSGDLPLTEVETPHAMLPDPTPGGERVTGAEEEEGAESGGPPADRTGDNLVLRLTLSLARQLQNMFGAVRGHLLPKGKINEDDLEVLLSERAAAEIYQKWVDTLEAKRIEHTVQSELRIQKDAALAWELQEAEKRQLHPPYHEGLPGSDGAMEDSKKEAPWEPERKRKKQRHNTTIPPLSSTGGTRAATAGDQPEQSTCPEPPAQKLQAATSTSARPLREVHVIDELAAHIEDQEVVDTYVRAVCHGSAARQRNLKHLYNSFPLLDRAFINRILVGKRFNFKNTADKLLKECRERRATTSIASTDGNLPSNHTGKTASYSKKTSRGVKANRGAKAVIIDHGRHRGRRSGGKAPSRSQGGGARGSSSSASPAKLKKQKTHVKPRKQQQKRKGMCEKDQHNTAAHERSPYQPWATDQAQLSYDDLRAEAALHANLRAEAFHKAAHARSRKQGEIATYYAQQGHMHTQKMREADERAAEVILKLRNDVSSNSLDLHGLHVSEALEALQKKLATGKGSTIYVITGKGIHSKGREARIKPAVVQYLQQNGYSYEEPNPGMMKVKV